MQSLDNLIIVCSNYLQGKFDIEEFQNKIITAAIPENLSKQFLNSFVAFDNKIERAIFCCDPATRELQGHLIAEELLKATYFEKNRMQNNT